MWIIPTLITIFSFVWAGVNIRVAFADAEELDDPIIVITAMICLLCSTTASLFAWLLWWLL